MKRVAFITGASRGIGRTVALKLAQEGWDIVIAAKTTTPNPKLPGTIYSVAEEVERLGVKALPLVCNVLEDSSVQAAAQATLQTFGRVDAVINNAGAIWFSPLEQTPLKKYELVMGVNFRGSLLVAQAFLPTLRQQGSGHILNMSPPIDLTHIGGHIPYMVSKFGMTMMILGLAEELRGTGVSASALWPRTLVESLATINWKMGDRQVWRKPEILADATWAILQHPEWSHGQAWIDEEVLQRVGVTDFSPYLCEPHGNPQELRWEDMQSFLR